MFVGHYAASFALKAKAPQVPLWVLFLAAQAVDIGWNLLIFAGIEHARYVPGFTKAFPIDLYYMPYTHSLVASVLWALACGALYFFWRRQHGIGAAMVVGLVVLSHWFLDLPVHPRDLPLYGDAMKQGFGLWNYPLPELLLEVGLLLAAAWLYARAMPQHARRAWTFAFILAAIQAGQTLGPWMLTSVQALSAVAFVAYLAFAYFAYRVERVRS
jgi:hypothetical protein